MTYLDTGCLLKLYYPEVNSADVVRVIAGKTVAFTALHDLEIVAALQLKRFRGEATQEQAEAATSQVQADLASGKLVGLPVRWPAVWRRAAELAQVHSAKTGCRSLDVLHCAVALAIMAERFVSSDHRQVAVATAAGLNVAKF